VALQLNRTGIGLIAFFALVGLALAIAPFAIGVPGQVAWILAMIGVIWFLVAAGLALFARRQQAKAAHQDWVFQNGIRGTATVVDAGSHATVNEMPVMKLKLKLDVPGVAAAEVSRREIMSVFAARRMEPGLQLPVYVNPGDHGDFVLVW
jgi:preprotein translocase subunit YajC